MKIFRMVPDFSRCRWFHVNRFANRDVFGNAMLAGESLLARWEATQINYSPPVDRGEATDIVQVGWTYAAFGVNARAAEVLRPWIESSCELLPFVHGEEKYWVLYLRETPDCLNRGHTMFHNLDESPRNIDIPVFDPKKMSNQPLFRVPRGNDYFVTEDLKAVIEREQLTGVRFKFAWSDDDTDPDEPELPPPAKRRRKRVKKPAHAPTQRELLLERLWGEVILSRGDSEELEQQLAIARFHARAGDAPDRFDSGRILRRLVKAGVSKDELLNLLRSVAYEVVFDVLIAIEEECLDKSPELESLHEDLLMAEPE